MGDGNERVGYMLKFDLLPSSCPRHQLRSAVGHSLLHKSQNTPMQLSKTTAASNSQCELATRNDTASQFAEDEATRRGQKYKQRAAKKTHRPLRH